MIKLANWAVRLLDRCRALDFLAPLALRLYLVPVFWMAGVNKLHWNGEWSDFSLGDLYPNEGIIQWFGNKDWGLGLPAPELLAVLATYTEFFGAIALAIGLAVRLVSIPLMITMLVAIFTVHWDQGWAAIASAASQPAAAERLDRAKDILREHGNYDWLTSEGSLVVLNNGIEFGVTYFVMLLALFFIGAGRYLSVDYWLRRRFGETEGV